MSSLRRTRACGFSLEDALPLEEARRLAGAGELAQRVRPVDVLFAGLPAVTVTQPQALRFCNGGALAGERTSLRGAPPAEGSRLRLYGPGGVFLGLAGYRSGELAPLKIFAAG